MVCIPWQFFDLWEVGRYQFIPSQVAPPGSASCTAAASAAAKQAAQCGLQATDVERVAVLAVAWKKFHRDVRWERVEVDGSMDGDRINGLCFTYLKMWYIGRINPVGLEYPWLDGLKWNIHKITTMLNLGKISSIWMFPKILVPPNHPF